MKITILCVGKIKERYFSDAINEYVKRLAPYANINIIEVPDEKIPDKISINDATIIKDRESDKMMKHLPTNSYKIALAIEGRQLNSEQLAGLVKKTTVNGYSSFTFIIGGSLGLSKKILNLCDYALSFSLMTFPHQLMRVILLEQVYRGMKILAGEPYHK